MKKNLTCLNTTQQTEPNNPEDYYPEEEDWPDGF